MERDKFRFIGWEWDGRVLEKVEMKESQVCYGYVGRKEDLKLIGNGDALYEMSEKVVGGTILLLADKNLTRVSLIHWK